MPPSRPTTPTRTPIRQRRKTTPHGCKRAARARLNAKPTYLCDVVLDDLRHGLQPLGEAIEEAVHPAEVVGLVVGEEDLAPASFLLEQDFLSAWGQVKTTDQTRGQKPHFDYFELARGVELHERTAVQNPPDTDFPTIPQNHTCRIMLPPHAPNHKLHPTCTNKTKITRSLPPHSCSQTRLLLPRPARRFRLRRVALCPPLLEHLVIADPQQLRLRGRVEVVGHS